MDRLDALEAFVVIVERGSLSGAARALKRSAASITRALAALEARLGAELLRRTTRSLKLTEAGERYLVVARRVLAELAEADKAAGSALDTPQGTLTVTAPVVLGTLHVRPAVDAYLDAWPEARARLLLFDRVVSLLDEGVDVAVRIAHLPDSALLARAVGSVRRVVCASPGYLARHGRPAEPAALAAHRCVSCAAVTPSDAWHFGPGPDEGRARQVKVKPALTVNTVDAALGSALAGQGLTCVLSYQAARALREGALVRVLARFEPAPLPVHLVWPAGGHTAAKVRAFVELAAPRLKAALTEGSPSRGARAK